MTKKSKISLFVLVILSGVGLVFLVTSSVNATAPAGTISYWKLDETPAGDPPDSPVTYIDSIPVTGNDGQDNGDPPTSTTETTPPTAGQVNGAQQFDGTATGIDIPADVSFDWGAGDSFSIELWLRQPNALVGINEVYVGREANAVDNDLVWWVGIWDATPPLGATAQAAAFVLVDSAGDGVGPANFLSGTTALAGVDGDWHHIVAVRDALAGENYLYVDGNETPVDTGPMTYTGGFAAADDLNIGYLNFNGVDRFFAGGAADEVALYNRALTPQEVNAHYEAGLLGNGIDTISSNPVANAGVDQKVAESAAAELDGSGSTGRGITYSWTQTAGTGVTLTGETTATPTFTTPAVAAAGETLTFELTVTDDVGTTSPPDTVVVTVVDSPVANAGVDQKVAESNLVTLDGTGSTGSNITFAWTAPAGVTLSDPTAPSPTFTAPDVDAAGETLTFELTVTDDVGTISTDPVDVAVVDSPVANAGVDQKVAEDNQVTLDGTGSTGSNITFAWTAPAGVTLSDLTAPSPTFIAPDVDAAGETLTFQLTVTDDVGTTSTDPVDVAVVDSPVANAGVDQQVAESNLVTLDGTGSTGSNITFAWTPPAGVTLSDPTAPSPTFTAPDVDAAGETLTFQLTVTDDIGIISPPDTVDVIVADASVSPVADAGVDQQVAESNLVTLDGTGSTGSNITFAWTPPAGVALSDPTAPSPTFTAPDVDAAGETLTFQLTVTDDIGITSPPDTVDVIVADASVSPVADAGADQTVAPDAPVTLDGSASTGTGLTYAWSQTAGTVVQLAGDDTATPTFTAPSAADIAAAVLDTLTFELTVTNDDNISSTAFTNVNVDDGSGGGGGGGGGGCFITTIF